MKKRQPHIKTDISTHPVQNLFTYFIFAVDVAKSKWRNLKDCFTKHLKSTKTTTGQISSKYLHWHWAKHMEFMKPYLNFASKNPNMELQSTAHVQDPQSNSKLQGSQSSSDFQATLLGLDIQRTHMNLNIQGNHQSGSDVRGTQSNSNVQGTQSSSDVQGEQSNLSAQGILLRSHGDSQRRRHRTPASSISKNIFLNTDKIIQYFENNKRNDYDATELILLGYAKSIKQFSVQGRARIKMNIAKIIMEEEIAHFEERDNMFVVNQSSKITHTSRNSLSPNHNAQ